jgi:TolA-binding protein
MDTNVLLSDPEAIFEYPGAEIVLPETVLGELDKIKTSRVDPDLRFRGRKVSRALFDLSEEGNLTAGIPMKGGGVLRVVPLDKDFNAPDGLSMRNADDRIIATAFQVCEKECEQLTLVTNDLNMLLKAQTLGLDVDKHEGGLETSFGRRYIVRPFQRYRIPLAILGISLAVFAAIVFLVTTTQDGNGALAAVPTEFRSVLSDQQERILDLSLQLQENPADLDTKLQLGNEYFELRERTGDPTYADLARKYYEQYLQARPDDAAVHTDLAITYYVLGRTDRAIQEATAVLQQEPDHVNANYNLGIFYWKGRGDYEAAAAQFRKVIELTESGDMRDQGVYQQALDSLQSVIDEAAAHGQPIDEDTTVDGGTT